MSKSHVSVEMRQCVVCCCTYPTGGILLNKRLRDTLEPQTVVGTGLCPEHQARKDEGYIALIVADEKTQQRTGEIIHVRAEAWPDIFTAPAPAGMVAYIDLEGADKLRSTPVEGE